MDEGIYWDDIDAELSVTGNGKLEVAIAAHPPGVAGEVAVELIRGVIVRVDFTEPQVLLGIDIDVRAGVRAGHDLPLDLARVLESLVGARCAAEIEAVCKSGFEGSVSIRGVGARLPHIENNPLKNTRALALGEIAHLLDIANDGDELLGVRIVAAFEPVRRGWRLDDEFIMEKLSDSIGETLREIRLVHLSDRSGINDLEADFRELSLIDAKIASMAANIIGRDVKALAPEISSLCRTAIRILKQRMDERVDGDIQKNASFDTNLRFSERAGDPVVAEEVPGRLKVTWSAQPDGKFLRLLSSQDQSIAAVAPIIEIDGTWEAKAVIPLDLQPSELLRDETNAPFPIAGQSAWDKVMHAIQLGRQAMRETIRGREYAISAKDSWEGCAAAWAELGDHTRAEQARDYANGRFPNRQVLLADVVRNRLEGVKANMRSR